MSMPIINEEDSWAINVIHIDDQPSKWDPHAHPLLPPLLHSLIKG